MKPTEINTSDLKTLKDMPRLQLNVRTDDMIQEIVRESDAINSDILKREAIKWIKELKKYEDNNGFCPPNEIRDFVTYNEYGHDTENVIAWIEKFFNISAEDLQ